MVLVVPNEDRLWELRRKLIAACVDYVAVREPDPPWFGQLMAIGVVPRPRDELRKHLSSLPLLC